MAKKSSSSRGASKKASDTSKTARTKKSKTSAKKSGAKTTASTRVAGKRSGGATAVKLAPKVQVGKPPKSPLSKKELNEFREMLLQKRRMILGDMSGMEAEAFRAGRQDGSGDLSNMPVHMADVGTDNYEQEFTLGLLESERQLLREINEALARIANGSYGICMGTGNPIAKPRLMAKPWAKYCIEYARMVEQGLVRQSSSNSYSFPVFGTEQEEPGAEDVEDLEETEELDETEEEDLDVADDDADVAEEPDDEDL